VVVVIKDKEQIALERFLFSIDTMIEVEGFNKDTSVDDAMTSSSLIQYFRSFIIKLTMIEAQIGQLYLGDDISFAIVIELKDDASPSHSDSANPPPLDSSCNAAHNVWHFRRCRAPYDTRSQHGCYQLNIQLFTPLQLSDIRLPAFSRCPRISRKNIKRRAGKESKEERSGGRQQ